MEENIGILTLLFSKESIAGVWAVIGAFFALLGVFANNFYENRRRKKIESTPWSEMLILGQ